MAGKSTWSYLTRVSDESGTVNYADLLLPSGAKIDELDALLKQGHLQAKLLQGSSIFDLQPTDTVVNVKQVLGPLGWEEVPLVRCIGLNYKTHILETGHPLPQNPTLFIKPAPSIADHDADVPIPKTAQAMLDYEGELTIVIGKEGKDITPENALDHIAGYTVGNDVSARDWQTKPEMAGPRPQWCFGKGFDKFAPVGPVLVATQHLGDCKDCSLTTKVNGQQRQQGLISDLVFGVRDLVAFCSKGQTLQKGTVIMTGTPGGVGLFMDPKTFLKDGDVVEVSVSGIGTLRNKMRFE